MFAPFARFALFLVACCGWGVLFFGAWIAWRGATFYDSDAVLMGTGGGLAIGGLLVIALCLSAGAQLSTARDTAAIRALMEKTRTPGTPATTKTPGPQIRAEPRIGRNS